MGFRVDVFRVWGFCVSGFQVAGCGSRVAGLRLLPGIRASGFPDCRVKGFTRVSEVRGSKVSGFHVFRVFAFMVELARLSA